VAAIFILVVSCSKAALSLASAAAVVMAHHIITHRELSNVSQRLQNIKSFKMASRQFVNNIACRVQGRV